MNPLGVCAGEARPLPFGRGTRGERLRKDGEQQLLAAQLYRSTREATHDVGAGEKLRFLIEDRP